MSAKKNAQAKPFDYMQDLTQKADHLDLAERQVKAAKETRDETEVVLESARAKIWRLLGTPFGNVRLGGFRFSRLMLVITGAFFGMLFGALVLGPVIGLLLAFGAVAGGVVWIKSKF